MNEYDRLEVLRKATLDAFPEGFVIVKPGIIDLYRPSTKAQRISGYQMGLLFGVFRTFSLIEQVLSKTNAPAALSSKEVEKVKSFFAPDAVL